MTRTAISPRLAISTLENTLYGGPVDLDRARFELASTRFSRFDWVDEIGSTNVTLLERARSGEGEQVLGADHQTAGRGRLGRIWQAPPRASILCSVLIRAQIAAGDAHVMTAALGLAAADACSVVAGYDPGLKWPNDLVAVGVGADGSDRKLAGILAESVLVGGNIDAVSIGIGLNVNWPEALPDDLVEIATSLRHLTGSVQDRTALVVEMLRGFDRRLGDIDQRGPTVLLDELRQRSATLGRRVRIELPRAELYGIAVDLSPSGALIIEDDQGVRRDISVGDVVHLRPAE